MLDRNSDRPLHRQLSQIFLQKIEGGEWQEGQVIPREVDIMESFGVSRFTVRQALEELAKAGYLERTKKRGTVVRRFKVEQNLSGFYSFARDMAAQGLEPTSKLLSLEEIEPDEETVLVMGLPEETSNITHLRRLRMVNNEPLLIEDSYLALPPTVDLKAHDWRIMPLYNVLETQYGIKVERAEEFLEPCILGEEEADLLESVPGAPAFRVERLTYDRDSHLFERRISLIRGDRYRFHIELPKVELLK
ncbi:MAG TPA: GntR family transcriptional regulator [Chloroflexia bacterium]|nr:GntR family transcriptional regulator [Chloroflexia bacterium]